MNRKGAIYTLAIIGFLNTLIGKHEIAAAFFIAAYLYDAIKPEDKQ